MPCLSIILESVSQAKEDTEHPTEHPTQRFSQYKAPSGPSLANPYDKVLSFLPQALVKERTATLFLFSVW